MVFVNILYIDATSLLFKS